METRRAIVTSRSGATGFRAVSRLRGRAARLVPLVVVIGVAALVYALGWPRLFSPTSLVEHRATLRSFVAHDRLAAMGVYVAVYATAVALSIPGGWPLTVLGGLLFGGAVGGALAAVSATIGAGVIFLAARTAFGSSLRLRNGSAVEKLAAGLRADAFNYLLFLRLVPVFPFWLVNLAPALLNIRLSTFLAATAIGILPATFAYAFVGSGLDHILAEQELWLRMCRATGQPDCRVHLHPYVLLSKELLLAFALLGLVALVPIAVRRLRARSRGG